MTPTNRRTKTAQTRQKYRNLHRAAFAVVAVLVAQSPVAADSALDASLSAGDIAARSIAAAGGARLDSVASVRRQGDIHISGEMFGELDGTWTVAFIGGKKAFQIADFMQAATSTGWDGANGWEESVMGTRDLHPAEIAVNKLLWEVNTLHAAVRDGRGDELKRLADEALAEVAHYVVHLPASDGLGEGFRIYVHPETWRISRVATFIEIPPQGTSAVVCEFFDYAETDGVWMAGRTKQSFENLFDLETVYKSTEIDPELDDSLFAKPGS